MEERTDRIQIDESVIDIYKTLSEGDNPEEFPFVKMADVFLLAACLGYEMGGRRQPLPEGKKRDIRQEVFGDHGMAILRALAVAETGDVSILENIDEVLTISEEFAQLGIYELQSQLLNSHGRPLWVLVSNNFV